MQTVILAGGEGKRVFPLAANSPKPMFKLLGKPLIHHVIDTLKQADLKEYVIVVGHCGEQIKDYLNDGSKLGVNIQYAEQKQSLGMADALQTTKDLVDDNFFVVNADDIFEASLIENMKKKFNETGAQIILSCKSVKETWKFGIIQVENEQVTDFVEKPPKGREPSNLAVVGVYILTKNIFDYYKKIPVSDHQYEDAILQFIKNKNVVKAVNYDGFFAGYKYPWDLFTINNHLMDNQLREQKIHESVNISNRAIIEGNVWISEGVKALEGACIRGPCFIGKNCVIGNNSLVRDYSSLAQGCVVGFATEIKHSLIGDNCWFHTNYIGDSIISNNCLFGAGTITANYRFDEKNIKIKIADNRIDSGTNKLGAIIGDNCKTGINSCIEPGIKIGPQSFVGPNVNLQEDLEPNKIILINKSSYIKKPNKVIISEQSKNQLMKKLLKNK
ncbi:MAG: NTP transferase domain-containing protein [Candidatus Bathyarchaeota archaeon]|nr:MAG: sugar phosphate nucleotidyltransferase [Candidatus Bathyarchaeum tardum]WNZ29271.1 MAG: NTP transferase domain-containing protein [Candidatus Bathyarchaeota archaeon]